MVLSRRFLVLAAMLFAVVAALVAALSGQASVARARDRDFDVGCSSKDCWPSYSYRDEDTDVIAAQYLLRSRGYTVQPSSNGFFTSQTTAAVRDFQRKRNLDVTSTVNAATWQKIVSAR